MFFLQNVYTNIYSFFYMTQSCKQKTPSGGPEFFSFSQHCISQRAVHRSLLREPVPVFIRKPYSTCDFREKEGSGTFDLPPTLNPRT